MNKHILNLKKRLLTGFALAIASQVMFAPSVQAAEVGVRPAAVRLQPRAKCDQNLNAQNTGGTISAIASMAAFAADSASRGYQTASAKLGSMTGCRLVNEGKASHYGEGDGFAGRRTTSGQRMNPNALTIAHPTLPMGTKVVVVDPKTGRKVEATVTDRGPSKSMVAKGRGADLSAGTFRRFASTSQGILAKIQIWRCDG